MHRDLALEAVISEDCTRPEPYLVYADWLQARGDLRGTFIALQDAVRREPANRAAATEADRLLEEHAKELLGEFYMRNDVELTWFQGFIKTVRLRGQMIQPILSGLRAVFDTPAAAFVQAITIVHPEETDRVVKLLAEHGKPQTLSHLAIGKPSEWQVPPDLLEAFPRMSRDPATVWAEAVEQASAQRRLATDLDVAKLPPLAFHADIPPTPIETILVGLKAEVAKQRPIGMLHALAKATTRESLDRFAHALAVEWESRDTPPGLKWAFDAIGVLGGDRCAAYLADRVDRWEHARALQALGHLRTIGSDVAITELYRLSNGDRRRDAAIETLELAALDRNADSLAQLIATACPRAVDADVAERTIQLQRTWLSELMISGERLAAGDFERHVVHHALRKPLVAGLLWGAWHAGELRAELTVDAAPELDPAWQIGVIHPLELTAERRAHWQAVLAGRDVPFPQLDRPIFEPTPAERAATSLTRYKDRKVGTEDLFSRLNERGWHHLEDHDGHWHVRSFPRDNVVARCSLDRSAYDIQLRRPRHWEPRRLDLHSAITLSEVIADMEFVHARRSKR